MTTTDFIALLQERYETINRATLDDITSLVKTISDTDRDVLWEVFVDSYEYNTPPKRATFKKLIYKAGLRERKNEKVYFGYCKRCKTGYPNNIRLCHYCGSELSMVRGESVPEKYVDMQRYCESCTKFHVGIQGAICKLYGTESHQWGLSSSDTKEQMEMCRNCPCRKCCYEEFAIRNHPKQYGDMLARGEFAGETGHIQKMKQSMSSDEAIDSAVTKSVFDDKKYY